MSRHNSRRWLIAVAGTALIGTAPLGSRADAAFDRWAALAAAGTTSPAAAAPGDLTRQWQAPDGRTISLVVRVPHPEPSAPIVTLPAVPNGADARPVFEAALEQARRMKAAKLVVPPGTYVFQTVNPKEDAHLVLPELSDFTLDASGAVFVFTQNKPGLWVKAGRRIRIANATLGFRLHLSSPGRIEERAGRRVLVIDPTYPVTAADDITYLTEYDFGKGGWVPHGQRIILPPGDPKKPVCEGDQTYTSPAFSAQAVGHTFLVSHYWYGGPALKVGDSPGPAQPEDVTIDRVTVRSAPGMGIIAYGLRRGFAVTRSTVAPEAGHPELYGTGLLSSAFDAIHIQELGGDLILADNHLAGQGDDGINLNNPVSLVSSIDDSGTKLVLAPYSRFIEVGHRLALFDRPGRFLGTADVTATKPLGGLNYEITLDRPVAGLEPGFAVRDLALIDSRYVVEGNLIEHCYCHGLLAQVPNGLIARNIFRDTQFVALKLLTNLGSFKEGVGAIDVIVRANEIDGAGQDASNALPWGAISAYGMGRPAAPAADAAPAEPPPLFNSDLMIEGNHITRADSACVTIADSRFVHVVDNVCVDTGLAGRTAGAINVLRASGVSLIGNVLSGGGTGGIFVDAATTTQIDLR